MPFVVNRGQRIHYTIDGIGPPVVLQHGLLLDAESWRRAGMIDAIAERYCVLCVDSLGHGLSDKPLDPGLYDQEQRAGDIAAVLDDIGVERANLIGHSMGGWLSAGMAKFHPGRLSSLVIGGWDLIAGLPQTPRGPLTFEVFMKFARRTTPQLVEWVTPDLEPGIRACFDALGQLAGAREAVLNLQVPVMAWSGRADAYYDPMSTFAAGHGLKFLATPGDHLGTIFHHGAETARGFLTFLDKLGDRSPAGD